MTQYRDNQSSQENMGSAESRAPRLPSLSAERVARALIARGVPAWPTESERQVRVIAEGLRVDFTVLASVLICACERPLSEFAAQEPQTVALACNRFVAGTYSAKAVVRRVPAAPEAADQAPVTVLRTESCLLASPGISDAQLATAVPEMVAETVGAQRAVEADAAGLAGRS